MAGKLKFLKQISRNLKSNFIKIKSFRKGTTQTGEKFLSSDL
jgi:hypothetical protein